MRRDSAAPHAGARKSPPDAASVRPSARALQGSPSGAVDIPAARDGWAWGTQRVPSGAVDIPAASVRPPARPHQGSPSVAVDIPAGRAGWAWAAAAVIARAGGGASKMRRVTFNLNRGGNGGGVGEKEEDAGSPPVAGLAQSPPRSILKPSPPRDAVWGDGADGCQAPACSSEFASVMEELYREGASGCVC